MPTFPVTLHKAPGTSPTPGKFGTPENSFQNGAQGKPLTVKDLHTHNLFLFQASNLGHLDYCVVDAELRMPGRGTSLRTHL